MSKDGGGWLRDNVFVVAAVALPLVVVGLFLLSAAVPGWVVDPPAHDLLFSAAGGPQSQRPRIAVEFRVHEQRVEARVRPLEAHEHPLVPRLYRFDHETLGVEEIAVAIPSDVEPGDEPRQIVVEALAGRQVLARSHAPDGYEFRPFGHGSSGLMSELFGMRRHRGGAAIVKSGHVVPIPMVSYYMHTVHPVGWLIDEDG